MKIILAVMCCLLLGGCDNTKRIDGVEYDVFGLANMDDKKNPNIDYEVSTGSVVIAVLFCETVIIPVYVLAFDLWEPVGKKSGIVGQVIR